MYASEATSLVGRDGQEGGQHRTTTSSSSSSSPSSHPSLSSQLRLALFAAGLFFIVTVSLIIALVAQESEPAVSAASFARELAIPPEANGHLLAFEYGNVTRSSSKVAVFDFDGTLAVPTACMGTLCPEHVWEGYREYTLTFAETWREVMRDYVAQGFKIVIVSNQGPLVNATGIRGDLFGRDVAAASPSAKQEAWRAKVLEVCQLLNAGAKPDSYSAISVPVQVFALLDEDKSAGFYKPCASWWRLFVDFYNDGVDIDCANSFYAGDAGGRVRGDTTNPWQNGTDQWEDGYWAASDRQFALTAGLAYKTPEEVFAGASPPAANDYHSPSFDGPWCDKGIETDWCAA